MKTKKNRKKPSCSDQTVYLGIGTNQGNRIDNIGKTVEGLRHMFGEVTVSPVYESDPVGVDSSHEKYLNCVVSMGLVRERGIIPGSDTEFAHLLLTRLQNLEKQLGRDMIQKGSYMPRIIDIDILLIDDLCINSRELTIPHPRMTERMFVLRPLLDLVPGLINPQNGRPFGESISSVENQGIYFFCTADYIT